MNLYYTITGGINVDTAHQLIIWMNSQIYSGSTPSKLTLFISSTGGDIDSAIRIYTYLKGLPIEVETIGFSQIDSAANIIFLAGKNRKVLDGCRFFLHEGTFTIGHQTAILRHLEESLRVLKELLDRSVKIVAAETKKTREEIADVFLEGKIYSSSEALDFGIVTEIIDKLPTAI
ncbi:MAG: peptidase ClpP [Candidatus Taylorbacteria bacterium]|nr:peptidase ClpP [Candidatus Taylorbacteria bacterium]